MLYQGITFRQAKSTPEVAAHVALRKQVFLERYGSRFEKQARLLAIMDRDLFDTRSVFFNAYLHDALVGTMRFVPDGVDGLPMEAESPLVDCSGLRSGGKLVEGGRLAISSEHQLNPYVLIGLLIQGSRYCLDEDVRYVVLDAPQHLSRMYGKIGFQHFLSAFGHEAGELFYPMFLDIQQQYARDRSATESTVTSYIDRVIKAELSRHLSDEVRAVQPS